MRPEARRDRGVTAGEGGASRTRNNHTSVCFPEVLPTCALLPNHAKLGGRAGKTTADGSSAEVEEVHWYREQAPPSAGPKEPRSPSRTSRHCGVVEGKSTETDGDPIMLQDDSSSQSILSPTPLIGISFVQVLFSFQRRKGASRHRTQKQNTTADVAFPLVGPVLPLGPVEEKNRSSHQWI